MRVVDGFTLVSLLASALSVERSACSKLGGGSESHPGQTTSMAPPSAAPAPVASSAAPLPVATNAVASASAAPSASLAVAAVAASAAPDPGMRPEDWEGALGKWSFENGELVCEGKATSSAIFYKPFHAKDFDLSVQFQFESMESSAGVLFRYQGQDFYGGATFYQFEWYAHGSHHDKRLSLMKKTWLGGDGPYWIQIVDPKYPEAPIGKWVTYRVRAEGEHLQTWVDGELVFDKQDKAFVRDGRVGLHTFMPRKMRYRGFKVESLDPK
jgi:hypothetical protein